MSVALLVTNKSDAIGVRLQSDGWISTWPQPVQSAVWGKFNPSLEGKPTPSVSLREGVAVAAIFTHNFDHRIQDFYHTAAVRKVARVACCCCCSCSDVSAQLILLLVALGPSF